MALFSAKWLIVFATPAAWQPEAETGNAHKEIHTKIGTDVYSKFMLRIS